MPMWDFLIWGNFIFIWETVWSLFHSLYIWLICVQCCFGSLLVEGTPAEDGCCRMCILHCGISYNCNPCTSGAHSKFCTRNLDLGNTTRYIQMCACLEFGPPFFFFLSLMLFVIDCLYSWDYSLFFLSVSLSTAFLIYVVASLSIVLAFILHFEPRCGQTNILIYLGICSLMGSLTVKFCFYFWIFSIKMLSNIYCTMSSSSYGI